MSNELMKHTSKTITQSKSVSGAAGKGLVVAGTGAIALSMLAALIPFVGVFGLGLAFLVLGAIFWE